MSESPCIESRKRNVAVVTVGRSDYGIYLPILRVLTEEPQLQLRVMAASAHLSDTFGRTVDRIEADGFPVSDRVEMPVEDDSAWGTAHAMALGVEGFAAAYKRARPDLLLVLGDRFDMFAAAVAAAPFCIPLAHIHGGEITEGAMDEQFRHAMTKLSHLHFASTQTYADRLVRMGEEPWRVTVSGAPALDHLRTMNLMTLDELQHSLDMSLEPAPLLATFHPATLEEAGAAEQFAELLAALHELGRPVVFTYPNVDPGHRQIIRAIDDYVDAHRSSRCFKELGTRRYFSSMRFAAAMIGNSSSGIIEAASFKLPVVNVGSRQRGRVRAANVVDVECRRKDLSDALRRVVDPAFKNGLKSLVNPYGDGQAAERIVRVLREIPLDRRLLQKRFQDSTET
ncbi:MAG TPA: UDP-N-acetylglucosamine 2-epimerase (hydrolyzing) [Verrucomicrobia bacterium]|nr:MAG: UDP-N-acetyl-D-glucosamine 2-epimerase, UDP-hydrolysing [Lentisphaerae bacterium GWF2_57_35]HBA83802.1 UDP-N-acetylglucosamine 2-epimerase (hydrolyzing) [Verrucomicrobiota bacterium]